MTGGPEGVVPGGEEAPPRDASDNTDQAIRTEIEAALGADTSVLGEAYRGSRDGLTDEEIRLQRGAENPNFIWN